MGGTIEHAREGLEHAHHAVEHGDDGFALWVALLIAALAGSLAVCELGEKASTRTYLTRNIVLSDNYAYYQEKHVRVTTLASEEALLLSLPNGATDAAIQARVKQSREEQARLLDNPNGDGMKQLQKQAVVEKAERNLAQDRAEHLELSVGGLQLGIVLASASIVTRVPTLAWIGLALGAAMSVYGALVWFGGM